MSKIDFVIYVVVTLVVLVLVWQARTLDTEGQKQCQVTYIFDGDTIGLTCDGTPRRARLLGFDTPEARSPQCAQEEALAHRATKRLREILSTQKADIKFKGHDKYGRDLIELRTNGRDVGEILIEENLARRYTNGSRQSWCE